MLSSPARPIVLLRRRPDAAPVADAVAPGSPLLGLMLPYSPIHHLLLAPVPGADAQVPDALVLTSANRSDEPICFTEDDAAQRLSALCDAVLDHDRPIHVPCDDSVVRVIETRRAGNCRSAAPAAMRRCRSTGLAGPTGPAVLAVGGELKNTFCLTDGSRAYLSGHIGDMATWETLRAFERAVGQLSEIRGTAVRLAADLHPGYHTRSWAERHAGDRPLDLVQHHHAHVVSLLAEHGRIGEPIVGVSFDGTGYGCDQTIWGGEILTLGPDSHRFVRVGHLLPVPLPGGDAAVRNPWRMALSQLWMADIDWTPDLAPVAAATPDELRLIRSQLESGTGCVPCSSMGRLFDAVASLLGVRHRIDYEGQAAIELEALAESAGDTRGPSLPLTVRPDGVIDPRHHGADDGVGPARRHATGGAGGGVPPGGRGGRRRGGRSGGRRRCGWWASPAGCSRTCCCCAMCRKRLQQAGFEVLTHHTVPPNDGGLALGQAAISVLTALRGGLTLMTTTAAIDRGLDAELAADLAATAFTLAKRFAAGATMWSIAPSWEPHALHIAVEFVHPVIVGKRALPAVALTGPDLVDLVRVSVRPGDIVVAVSGADDPQVRSVMRRSPAWGATTIWIGSGERPGAGMADHVLWLDDPDPRVPATGGFVLFYHLLWELTHVCFEHSGLLKPDRRSERGLRHLQRRRPPG